jgi:predicted dehydrogenase
MATPWRVAVVGCGIGKSHVRAYKTLPAQFDLTTICDIDEAKARALAAEHNIPNVVTDFHALLASPDLDIIDICTPPHLHFAQIKAALEAGKHAVCEKPLVGSLRDVDELARIEAASGKRLMPMLQKLKFLQEAGLTGEPYQATVETAWRRRAAYYEVPWRGKWATELGGALLGHAIHGHDILSYVLGPVRSVYARTATRVNAIEVEDCAAISLEMTSGALASLSVTLGSAAEISRHRFTFQNLSAESNTRPYTNSGDPWEFTGDTPELAAKIQDALAGFNPLPESFAGQFYRFAEALNAGETPPVTIADSRASLELITAMYHSAETGEPVTLPIGPEHPKYASWLPSE